MIMPSFICTDYCSCTTNHTDSGGVPGGTDVPGGAGVGAAMCQKIKTEKKFCVSINFNWSLRYESVYSFAYTVLSFIK